MLWKGDDSAHANVLQGASFQSEPKKEIERKNNLYAKRSKKRLWVNLLMEIINN